MENKDTDKNVNLVIERYLWQQAKSKAAIQGITLRDYITELLRKDTKKEVK